MQKMHPEIGSVNAALEVHSINEVIAIRVRSQIPFPRPRFPERATSADQEDAENSGKEGS